MINRPLLSTGAIAAAAGLPSLAAAFDSRPSIIGQSTAEWGIAERLLQPGNLAASTLLVMIVIAFIRGWIVPKYVYDAEKSRADRMEARAMEASDALRQAVGSVEKTASAVLSATAVKPLDRGH